MDVGMNMGHQLPDVPPETASGSGHGHWLRGHPYIAGAAVAVFCLLVGAFIVSLHSPVASQAPQSIAWGGNAGVLNPTSYDTSAPAQQSDQPSIMQQVQSGAPYNYIPINAPSPDGTTATNASDQSGFDFDAFVASLSQESAPKTKTSSGNSGVQSAYAFIPSGLMATSSLSPSLTQTQQDLYDYGNNVGSLIQSFEQKNPNESGTLKDQVENRGDPDKAAAVEALGQSLQDLGNSILAMDTVPEAMTSAHAALGNSYVQIGKNLALVPQAQSDTDFIAAINTYNASADIFTKRYIALAQLFGAYGVKFSPDDPGSVFTFTPTGL
jgi:hypothetical protein